jgi:hypothetical protein
MFGGRIKPSSAVAFAGLSWEHPASVKKQIVTRPVNHRI